MGKLIRITGREVEELKKIVSKHPEIIYLAITGMVANKGYSTHDIDIAVKTLETSRKYDILMKILQEASQILNIPEEQIDIIDLDRADLELKARIMKNSIVVYDGGYSRQLIKELEEKYPEYAEHQELTIREWLISKDSTTLDITMIKRRFDFIRSEVYFLKENILNKSLEEVKKSPILTRLLERSYQLIIEALIDIARHIVSRMGWSPCYTSHEFIYKLAEHNIISESIAFELTKAIRLRNIIIHRYLDIDYDELYNGIQKLMTIAVEFEKHIVEFLKKHI